MQLYVLIKGFLPRILVYFGLKLSELSIQLEPSKNENPTACQKISANLQYIHNTIF